MAPPSRRGSSSSSRGAGRLQLPHEQVREFAADTLAPARRRDPRGDRRPAARRRAGARDALLAHHARAAGDAQVCVKPLAQAAAAALAAHAPEEVLRVVEAALPQASPRRNGSTSSIARDDALAMLRRPGDRLEGLSELAALAEALGDARLDLDVTLRRAAARLSAAGGPRGELATRVRTLAVERGDAETELAACVELGQALLRAGLGGACPVGRRGGPRRRRGGVLRAQDLATELDDTAMLAAASRELGVIDIGRARGYFVELVGSRRARGRDGPCGRGRGARRGPAGAPGPPVRRLRRRAAPSRARATRSSATARASWPRSSRWRTSAGAPTST